MKRPDIPPAVLALSGTHLVNDIFSNIYAPLLPLFIPRLGLSLAAAGTIAMAVQIAGSMAQIVFGPLADRWRPRILVVWGPLVAVIFLSLAGLASSPLMLGAILVVGCLGSAAFHPTAAAIVNRVGGAQRGLAMSVHVTGGSVGNGLAPVIFAAYAANVGLAWTPLLAIPAIAVLAAILRRVPDVRLGSDGQPGGFRALQPYATPLALLWAVVVIRTIVAIGFSTFLPVMMTRRGLSVSEAGIVVTLYLLAGSFGGLLGGPIADRFGARRVIGWSLALTAPLLLASLVPGRASYVLLILGGLFLGSTLPVNISYAHAIAPVSAGTVSSLMLGVAWGVGSMAVPLVGIAGDAIGLAPAFQVLAAMPILGALLTIPLPSDIAPSAAHEPVEPFVP